MPSLSLTLSLSVVAAISVTSASANTWFVANSGNDSNPGTEAAPFATLTQAESVSSTGDTVRLNGGDIFRDTLDLVSTNNLTVSSYGSGKATVTGFDVAPNGNFTVDGTHGNVYNITWTSEGDGTANSIHGVWEGDFSTGKPLRWVADKATCQATEGTFTCSYAASSQEISIHPYGSTNPTSDSKTYQITRRNYCIRLGDSCVVEDIITKGHVADNGGTFSGLNSSLTRCNFENGSLHNLFFKTGTVEDCEFNYNYTAQLPQAFTMAVSFVNTAAAGLESILRNCTFRGGHPDDTDSVNNGLAAYAHAGDSSRYGLLNLEDCEIYGCTEPATAAADVTRLTRCNNHHGVRVASSGATTEYQVTQGFYRLKAGNFSPAANWAYIGRGVQYYDVMGVNAFVLGDNAIIDLEQCSMGHATSGISIGSSRNFVLSANTNNQNIRIVKCAIDYAGLAWLSLSPFANYTGITLDLADNVVYRRGGNTAFANMGSGNINLSSFATLTGEESDSIYVGSGTTPMFSDPSNQDFTVTSTADTDKHTIARNAGAAQYSQTQYVGLDTDIVSWITAINAASSIKPTNVVAFDNLVETLKSNGIWNALDFLAPCCGADTLAGAQIPLKGSATFSNFSDYTRLGGLKGNGSTTVVETNFVFDSSYRNDNSIGSYFIDVPSAPADTEAVWGVGDSDMGSIRGLVNTAGNTSFRNMQSAFPGSTGDVISSASLMATSRSVSSEANFYASDTNYNISSYSSQNPLDENLPFFARRLPSTGLERHTTLRMSFLFYGNAINLNTFNSNLDTLVSSLV